MSVFTPVTVLEGLSWEHSRNPKCPKSNTQFMSPWDDNFGLPTLKHKHHSIDQRVEVASQGKTLHRSDKLNPPREYYSKRRSIGAKAQGKTNGRTIRNTRFDMSDLGPHQTQIHSERIQNSKVKCLISMRKGHLSDKVEKSEYILLELGCIGQMRINDGLQRYQQMKKRIKRRQNKSFYDTLIPRDSLFTKDPMASQKAQVINFPMQINQRSSPNPAQSVSCAKNSTTTCNSFFVKHKMKKSCENIGEAADNNSEHKVLPLLDVLQLGKRSLCRVFN